MLIRAGRWRLNPAYVQSVEADQVPMGLDKVTRVVVVIGDGPMAREITFTGAEAEELIRLLTLYTINP